MRQNPPSISKCDFGRQWWEHESLYLIHGVPCETGRLWGATKTRAKWISRRFAHLMLSVMKRFLVETLKMRLCSTLQHFRADSKNSNCEIDPNTGYEKSVFGTFVMFVVSLVPGQSKRIFFDERFGRIVRLCYLQVLAIQTIIAWNPNRDWK